jgi:hypothetical protein
MNGAIDFMGGLIDGWNGCSSLSALLPLHSQTKFVVAGYWLCVSSPTKQSEPLIPSILSLSLSLPFLFNYFSSIPFHL